MILYYGKFNSCCSDSINTIFTNTKRKCGVLQYLQYSQCTLQYCTKDDFDYKNYYSKVTIHTMDLLFCSGDRSIEDETSQAEANDEIVQVTGYRRAMVKTMTKSGSVPQFGYCDEVRMDAVMRQVLQKP